MLSLMPSSNPESKPVEPQQQMATIKTPAPQQIGEEGNEKQKPEELNPTPFSTSPDPYK